ncbi:hypothetical protein BJX70DRAFT_399589 [Aspergillus crustosus]
MVCTEFDCEGSTAPDFQPNPDISGVGVSDIAAQDELKTNRRKVLVGFLATAWLAFFSLLFHYVAASSDSSSHLLDLSLRRAIHSALHWNPTGQWDKQLRTIVLTMSDQQLVTGIAILISGYSQLSCGLSLYHWQIVTTLTWFSTITHLGTLPFLSQYLRQHRYIFYLRVFLIFGLAIMLAIALLPNGNATRYGPTYPGRVYRGTLTKPVQCYFNSPNLGFDINKGGVFTILAEMILLLTLVVRFVRILPVSKNVSSRVLKYLRDICQRWLVFLCGLCQRLPRYMALVPVPPLVFGIAWLALAHMLVDLFRSSVFEIWWLMFSLIWGSIRLFSVRASLPREAQQLEEDQWGFGQLVPVLLLLIPVLMIAEGCSEIAQTPRNTSIALSPRPSSLISQGSPPSSPSHSHSLHVYSPLGPSIPLASSSNLSLAPSTSTSTIYNRLTGICTTDFRAEHWYQELLYYALSFLTGTSPLILAQAASNSLVSGAEYMIIYVCTLFFGGILCLMTLPLCGIIDSIEPRTRPRHSLSIIRIMTDSGKGYRRLRRVFYVCFPVLVAVILIIFFVRRSFPFYWIVWGLPLVLGFLPASFVAVFSVWGQVVRGK